MISSPFDPVVQFESEVANYCGAPFAVSTTSCCAALQLALMWFATTGRRSDHVSIPRLTYVGVGYAVVNSGHKIVFRDEDWQGHYRLEPYPVVDAARLLTSGMFYPGEMQCLSFHWSKHCCVGTGGMIVHDSEEADEWLRRVRYDGRRAGVAPKDDVFDTPGLHAYMTPATAAEGLIRMSLLERNNGYLPRSDYADLSLSPYFQKHGLASHHFGATEDEPLVRSVGAG